MSDYEIKITDNSDEIKEELRYRMPAILEAIALQAEGNAVDEITKMKAVDTGRLRGSISHTHDEDTAYIGTNVEYAPYVELGTHKMGARPFLRNAVSNYTDEYKKLLEDGLK